MSCHAEAQNLVEGLAFLMGPYYEVQINEYGDIFNQCSRAVAVVRISILRVLFS
jgi:hypothetical protein